MKKLFAPLVILLGASSVFAQSDTGVTVSTDPARAEAVERHAQELQARRAAEPMGAPGASAKAHGQHPHAHHPAARHPHHPHHKKP